MEEYGVRIDFPSLSADDENEAFLVLTGPSLKGVDLAKRLIRYGGQPAGRQESMDRSVRRRLSGLPPPPPVLAARPVARASDCPTTIFVDSSNILIGARRDNAFIDFAGFCKVIERGRSNIRTRFAVGRWPKDLFLFCFFIIYIHLFIYHRKKSCCWISV
jgi:hypothetical protein